MQHFPAHSNWFGDDPQNKELDGHDDPDGALLIVVEGYEDVIAKVSAGFPNAVAPGGAALTESQLALLRGEPSHAAEAFVVTC